jgi:hypothetical protein
MGADPFWDGEQSEKSWTKEMLGAAQKEWVGYKTQVAETVPEELLQKGEPTPAMGNQTEATAAVRPASQLSNRAKQIAARKTPDKSPNDPHHELKAP